MSRICFRTRKRARQTADSPIINIYHAATCQTRSGSGCTVQWSGVDVRPPGVFGYHLTFGPDDHKGVDESILTTVKDGRRVILEESIRY